MRPWKPNTKSAGLPGIEPRILRQADPVGAHCDSAHWATEAGLPEIDFAIKFICTKHRRKKFILKLKKR